MTAVNLTNQLLIAMPTLADPNFHRTVTLVCEHGAEGAIGVVINRPLELTLKEICEHLKLEEVLPEAAAQRVLLGGPVQMERGFILHQPLGGWESTLSIDSDIGLTSSVDVLRAIALGQGPRRTLVALGYAGWAPGQLEKEISENSWLTVPSDPDILFAMPYEERWQAAASKLGVDLNLMSVEAGHA
jgi:putative transcriptional regulator